MHTINETEVKMKTTILTLFILVFTATLACAVDKEYLERLHDDFLALNKNLLPIRLDAITTMEEIRILKLNNQYYVVTEARIDTAMKTMGGNSLYIMRKASIKSGCSDPATMNYMEHGLKIGAIYENRNGVHLGEFQYSIDDCN